jgi:hypothetical protein
MIVGIKQTMKLMIGVEGLLNLIKAHIEAARIMFRMMMKAHTKLELDHKEALHEVVIEAVGIEETIGGLTEAIKEEDEEVEDIAKKTRSRLSIIQITN